MTYEEFINKVTHEVHVYKAQAISKGPEFCYAQAYSIARFEAIAQYLLDSEDLNYTELAGLKNIVAALVEEDMAYDTAMWSNWDNLTVLIENFIKDHPEEAEAEENNALSDDDLIAEMVRRGISPNLFLEKAGYIAWKIWSEEDVAGVLEDKGYAVTDENIDTVINTGYLRALGECTDRDWEIINSAVYDRADSLQPEDENNAQ